MCKVCGRYEIFESCVEYSRKTWEPASYSCPEPGESTQHSHITFFLFPLIFSCHLCLGLANGLFWLYRLTICLKIKYFGNNSVSCIPWAVIRAAPKDIVLHCTKNTKLQHEQHIRQRSELLCKWMFVGLSRFILSPIYRRKQNCASLIKGTRVWNWSDQLYRRRMLYFCDRSQTSFQKLPSLLNAWVSFTIILYVSNVCDSHRAVSRWNASVIAPEVAVRSFLLFSVILRQEESKAPFRRLSRSPPIDTILSSIHLHFLQSVPLDVASRIYCRSAQCFWY